MDFQDKTLPEDLCMQLILSHIYMLVSKGNGVFLRVFFIVVPLCHISTIKFLHFLADEWLNNLVYGDLNQSIIMVTFNPKLNKFDAFLISWGIGIY